MNFGIQMHYFAPWQIWLWNKLNWHASMAFALPVRSQSKCSFEYTTYLSIAARARLSGDVAAMASNFFPQVLTIWQLRRRTLCHLSAVPSQILRVSLFRMSSFILLRWMSKRRVLTGTLILLCTFAFLIRHSMSLTDSHGSTVQMLSVMFAYLLIRCAWGTRYHLYEFPC